MSGNFTFSEFLKMIFGENARNLKLEISPLLDAFCGGKISNGELPSLKVYSDDGNPNTLKSIANGTKKISRSHASILFDNYHYETLEEYLNDSINDLTMVRIRNDLVSLGFKISDRLDDSEIPEVCAKLLKKIIYDLSCGRTSTKPPLQFLSLENISEVAFKASYFKDGALYINGEKIPLAKPLAEIKIETKENLAYTKALFDAYEESLDKRINRPEDLTDRRYKDHFAHQKKWYFEARYKENAAREIFDDGEDQFEALKDEIADTVYDCVNFGKFNDGLEKLSHAMELAIKAQLNKSLLLKIVGFIGVSERRGILHILVEDRKIFSWVGNDGE